MKENNEFADRDWKFFAQVTLVFMLFFLAPVAILLHKVLIKSGRYGLVDTDPMTGEKNLNFNFTAFRKKTG